MTAYDESGYAVEPGDSGHDTQPARSLWHYTPTPSSPPVDDRCDARALGPLPPGVTGLVVCERPRGHDGSHLGRNVGWPADDPPEPRCEHGIPLSDLCVWADRRANEQPPADDRAPLDPDVLAECRKIAVSGGMATVEVSRGVLAGLVAAADHVARARAEVHDAAAAWAGVYAEVAAERVRADAKHAPGGIERMAADDPHWLPVLVEEVGEVATELLPDRRSDLRAELVQVAAVATAWVDAIDRVALADPAGDGR